MGEWEKERREGDMGRDKKQNGEGVEGEEGEGGREKWKRGHERWGEMGRGKDVNGRGIRKE
jgi:hypothetical protein